MASMGTLTADLRLRSAAFLQDLRKASQATATNTAKMRFAMRQLEQSGRAVQRQFGQIRGAAAALVGALAVRQFVRFSQTALETADNIAKTADSIGLTTDALQEYRVVADLAGVSQEKFDSALQAFAKRVGELRSNTGALVTFLDRYDKKLLDNLRTTNTTTEAFELFLSALANTPNALDRAALSGAAFGRGAGAQMVIMTRDGTAAIDEMRKRAVELGLVLEQKLARAAEETQDRMTLLQKSFEIGFVRGNVLALAGEFKTTEENIRAARVAGEQFGMLVGQSVRGLVAAIEFVGRNIREIATALAGIIALKAVAIFLGLAGAIGTFAIAMVTAARAGTLMTFAIGGPLLGTIIKMAAVLGAAALTWEAFGKETMDAADKIAEAAKKIAGTGDIRAPMLNAIQQSTAALRLEAKQQNDLAAALGRSTSEYEAMTKQIEQETAWTKISTGATEEQAKAWGDAYLAAQQAKEGLAQMQAQQQEMARIAEQAFDRVGSAITEAFVQGKAAAVDWKSVMLGVISEIYQAMLKLTIIDPIIKSLKGAGGGGIGGFISKLFSGGGGGGGGGDFDAFADFDDFDIPVPKLHSGWSGAGRPPMTHQVPAQIFANAPRLHNGLKADEFPAILQTGEKVTPRGGGGDAGPSVFIDARNADAGGMRRLETMIARLNGSIEKRSVAAVIDAQRRGGSRMRQAFA